MIIVNQSAYGRSYLDQTSAIGLRSMDRPVGTVSTSQSGPLLGLHRRKSARPIASSRLVCPPLTPPASLGQKYVCMYVSVYVATYWMHGFFCTS